MGAFAAVAQGADGRAAADHAPPRAARRGRAAARPRRQGRDVRHRRLLDQAGRADARDEVRHVRRRGGARGDRRDRGARAADPAPGRGRRDREPASRAARCGRATSSARAPGITIEVNNTDAEGRLVLADCLTHARDQGAERLLDLATLTGGDRHHASGPCTPALMGNDDAWCDAVRAAGEATGERVWRLPLDPLYDELIKGRYGDLINSIEGRKAQLDHGRRVPRALRGRRAVGAPRHRRRRRRARQAVRAEGRVGLGRAAAARARPASWRACPIRTDGAAPGSCRGRAPPWAAAATPRPVRQDTPAPAARARDRAHVVLRFRAGDGRRLRGRLTPATQPRIAPAVVLVHGLYGEPAQWDEFVGHLHRAGFDHPRVRLAQRPPAGRRACSSAT